MGGPSLQGESQRLGFGWGRRYKGISSAAWFRVLLQHAGAVHPGSTQTRSARTKSPCSDVLRNRGVPRFGVPRASPSPGAIPVKACWTASTKPRTCRWRKTRWCGDRVQAGHGWPALACWSQGWRNQAMRTIPAPPRLPPEGDKSRRFGSGQKPASPHEASGLRRFSAWPDPESIAGEEPYSRPSWWARHSWVHTASMRCSTFGSRVIGRPHSRADSAGHLRVASRPSLEPRPDTGVAKSR